MLLTYYVFEIVIFNFQTLNTKTSHVQNGHVDGFLAILSVRLQTLKIGHVQEKTIGTRQNGRMLLASRKNFDKKFRYCRR